MTISGMLKAAFRRAWHLIVTPYEPDPAEAGFRDRTQTQEAPAARVMVAVLTSPVRILACLSFVWSGAFGTPSGVILSRPLSTL